MRCPNCNTEIADHLKICWFCNSNLITLENFLNKKSKLLVIIGVFGALSIYLLQTAKDYSDNPLLQFASGISLLVMITLSSRILADCYFFIKKFPSEREYGNEEYRAWTKQTIDLLYLWAFFLGLMFIVLSVLIFMIFFSKINQIASRLLIGFIVMLIVLPLIILPSNALAKRKKNLLYQLFLIFPMAFLFFVSFIFLLKNFIVDFTSTISFFYLILAGVSFIGLINLFSVTFQTLNEKNSRLGFCPLFQGTPTKNTENGSSGYHKEN